MKLSKKHYIIIAVALVLIAIWYFFLRKKSTTTSSYNPAIPIYGAGMGEPTESNYIACGEGQCEITWSYWTDTNPPVKMSGSYCGSCSTGAPKTKVAIKAMPLSESNFSRTAVKAPINKQAGGGLCTIKWTDDKGVEHFEEIPCGKLRDVISKA